MSMPLARAGLRTERAVSGYRALGPFRLPSRSEARYHAAQGEYAYGEFVMENVVYNSGVRD